MSVTTNMMAIAVDKSLLKEYSTNGRRTVYLENGDEFQIKLFNPETHRIAASVYLNGEYIGNDLILRPGEICWLERYLNVAKKFRFETYEVEDGDAKVDKAIKENGTIEVRFYREKPRPREVMRGIEIPRIDHGIDRLYSKGITAPITQHVYTCNSTGAPEVAVNSIMTSSLDCEYSTSSTSYATLDWMQPSTKETGRVAEGAYSNQRFETVDMDIESWAFHTEVIKILPRSQKPFTKNDLEKVFCTECGRKIKTKFKYCPFCGAKQ